MGIQERIGLVCIGTMLWMVAMIFFFFGYLESDERKQCFVISFSAAVAGALIWISAAS